MKTAASFTSERKLIKNAKSHIYKLIYERRLIEASGGSKGGALERRFHLIFKAEAESTKARRKRNEISCLLDQII